MRILITGGAGFIGSHSVDAALASGHSVRIIDNLSTGSPNNVPAEAELIVGDVTDRKLVRAVAEGCDAFLHLAALVSAPESLAQPVATFDVNAAATVNVLEAARQVVRAASFLLLHAQFMATFRDAKTRTRRSNCCRLMLQAK